MARYTRGCEFHKYMPAWDRIKANQPGLLCIDAVRWAESTCSGDRLEPLPALSSLHMKTTSAQKRIDFRISTPKITVGLSRIHAIADAHDVIMQSLCNGFVERVTRLHEGLERIVIENFGP